MPKKLNVSIPDDIMKEFEDICYKEYGLIKGLKQKGAIEAIKTWIKIKKGLILTMEGQIEERLEKPKPVEEPKSTIVIKHPPSLIKIEEKKEESKPVESQNKEKKTLWNYKQNN
jgi:hypothetical protein